MRTKRLPLETHSKSTAIRNKKSLRIKQKFCIRTAFHSPNKTKKSKFTSRILRNPTQSTEHEHITEDPISLKISSPTQHSQVFSLIWIGNGQDKKRRKQKITRSTLSDLRTPPKRTQFRNDQNLRLKCLTTIPILKRTRVL